MNYFPFMLIILDGFGHNKHKKYNAIAQANTPFLDFLYTQYPHTFLQASGKYVGLLDRFIGNSEVGHITIGAGRVIDQPVKIIHNAIEDGSFYTNPILLNALQKVPKKNTAHIIGLLSDAGVHAHIAQIFATIKVATQEKKNIVIHAILDGRDTPPKSATIYLEQLQKIIDQTNNCQLGSIHGRFYAMDRDNKWERTEKSYNALTKKETINFTNWQESINFYYSQAITDEFIPPTQFSHNTLVQPNDGIIFMNFRPDRARQLTAAFTNTTFTHFSRPMVPLSCFITPASYGNNYNTTVLYPSKPISSTLKEILSKHNKKIFVIAETEKYAHVTYFLSGGQEKPFAHETQCLIPSIPKKTYIDQPEMSAPKITDTIIKQLQTKTTDFYIINYANADMVGHSGNMHATIKAIECLDQQLQKLYTECIEKQHGTMLITADHGNAEDMFDPKTNQSKTSHTTNKVPFIFVNKEDCNIDTSKLIGLADITPFILEKLGISVIKKWPK